MYHVRAVGQKPLKTREIRNQFYVLENEIRRLFVTENECVIKSQES